MRDCDNQSGAYDDVDLIKRWWQFYFCLLALAGCNGADPSVSDNAVSARTGKTQQIAVVTGSVKLTKNNRLGGVRVETVGRADWTVTNEDGSFRLDVNVVNDADAGIESQGVKLQFTRDGYTKHEEQVTVSIGEETQLDDVVTLEPLPGQIAGRVNVPIGFNVSEVASTLTINLVHDENGQTQTGSVNAEGGFSFDDLEIGNYRLEISGKPFVAVGITLESPVSPSLSPISAFV